MKSSREIIIQPMITEKSTLKREMENIYTFKVACSANKNQIKHAVEELFQIKVLDVHTMKYLGKMKTMGRFTGRKPLWKKAVVKVEEGHTIPLFEGL